VRDALSLSWRRDQAISILAMAKSSELNGARHTQHRIAAGPVAIMGSRSITSDKVSSRKQIGDTGQPKAACRSAPSRRERGCFTYDAALPADIGMPT
jgi:hypothetical protein